MPGHCPISRLAVLSLGACSRAGMTYAVRAQVPDNPDPQLTTEKSVSPDTDPLTMAPHPDGQRWWISGQANSIFQMHGHFHSPYEGANSLRDTFETKASEVATLYLGYQLHPRSEEHTSEI